VAAPGEDVVVGLASALAVLGVVFLLVGGVVALALRLAGE
jgi:hypothetical protein